MKDPPADDVISEPTFAPKAKTEEEPEEKIPTAEIVKAVKKATAPKSKCECEETEPTCGCGNIKVVSTVKHGNHHVHTIHTIPDSGE